MKNKLKYAILISFILLLSCGGKGMVFVCRGPMSKRYHLTKSCKGLDNCSTNIDKVSIEEAKKMGRTLCGYED